jgi:hypothetical protein
MDGTIIGARNMGRGIGTPLVAGGNGVKILDAAAAHQGSQEAPRSRNRARGQEAPVAALA